MQVHANDILVEVDTGSNERVKSVEGYEITLESGLSITLEDIKAGRYTIVGRAQEVAPALPEWMAGIPVEGSAPPPPPPPPVWSPKVDPMLDSILARQKKLSEDTVGVRVGVPTSAALMFLLTMYTREELAESIAAKCVKAMVDEPDAHVKTLAEQVLRLIPEDQK